MIFTIKEIKQYLRSKEDLSAAIDELDEQAIMDCIPADDFNSLNFNRNEKSLKKYEAYIGMTKLIEHQRTIYKNSNGERGRYWMSLTPEWGSKPGSKYEMQYWVNYGDDHTYGQFSVEDIQRWFAEPELKLYEIGGVKER